MGFGTVMMNTNDFGGSLTNFMLPVAGQIVQLLGEISQNLLDGLEHNFVQTLNVPR